MNIAAYCRVSTEKSDQLNSLEAQKEFFSEYTKRTGDTLVRLYADEGISGTKIKNRKEFLRMMSDAEHGLFDMVVVKDMGDLGLDETILIEDSSKNIETGENAFDKRKNNGSSEMKSGDVSDDFTIPSSNDHT